MWFITDVVRYVCKHNSAETAQYGEITSKDPHSSTDITYIFSTMSVAYCTLTLLTVYNTNATC